MIKPLVFAICLYFPDELSINLTSSESCGFNTSCNGSDNGELTAQVSGGVPPYNYVWTDQDGNIISNSQTVSNLSAGFYTVTVTDDADDLIFDSNGDGLGVSCSETFEITEPEEILISLSEDEASNLNLNCNGDCDGSIFIDVAGGCPPYNFSWSNGESTEDLNNLCAGSYNLTVTDDNGCSEEITVEITEPDAITITENFQIIMVLVFLVTEILMALLTLLLKGEWDYILMLGQTPKQLKIFLI